MSSKRSKPGSLLRPPESREDAGNRGDDTGSRWKTWLSLGWLIGFSLYFYSFALPNNAPLTRFDLWFSLPELLPVAHVFSSPWGNLAQRADLFGVAALILAGAWGLGSLVLRLVGIPLTRRSERVFFEMGVGLGATSLMTLACGLAGLLNRWIFIGAFAGAIGIELLFRGLERRRVLQQVAGGIARSKSSGTVETQLGERLPKIVWVTLAVVAPFLFLMWLGSMSPERDFDVRAYHFEGPKEYFQNGRITFLPHNVYTNFPFLTEMFVLLGMVLRGDWYWGALAGKCVLFAFAPLTALGLYAAGRRWFGPAAGALAALVFLTTPWTYRLSIIALVEGGLTYYLFATLFAVAIAIERERNGESAWRSALLAGLLAGSAMACKYTAAMQVVLPAAIALTLAPFFLRRRSLAGDTPSDAPDASVSHGPRAALRMAAVSLAFFGLGLSLTVGPWLLKNVAMTGNPVYPLAYGVFGGRNWDPDLNARFVPAHSPKDFRAADLWKKVIDVAADNDWSSPLLFALAPLALLAVGGRKFSVAIWVVVAYLIVTYWAFTHRIDRFWVPLIPVVALLAGRGATWTDWPAWRWTAGVVIGLAVWFNLGFVAGTGLGGYNAMLSDLPRAREQSEQPVIYYLNQRLALAAKSGDVARVKVLCVGEGEVFDARFPLVYNTVFNKSIFQEWFAAKSPGKPARDLPLKPLAEIRAKLRAEGITHVYVNWDWIRRYRQPGNYGYTDFVTPSRFEQLVKEGLLESPVSFGLMSDAGLSAGESEQLHAALPFRRQTSAGTPVIVTGLFGSLSESDRNDLREFAPWLLTKTGNQDLVINAQIFPVQ